ncbi:MAG TPA: right-handed parallel beta-helix repeat-containing protein, partial [Actinomycetota bacterium]
LLALATIGVATPRVLASDHVTCDAAAVGPDDDVVAIVDAAPAGATVCLSGTFVLDEPIDPKDGQRLVGPAILRGDGLVTTGVMVRAPASSVGAMDVVIDDLEISGFTLRAIACWRGTVVRGAWLHDNGRNGIGCGLAGGGPLLVEDSVIERNGDPAHVGSGSAGIKVADGTNVTVRGSVVEANVGNGIWCDADCGALEVSGNLVVGSTRRGIFVEVSRGPALIDGNTVQRNNCSPDYWGDGEPDCVLPGGGFGPLSAGAPGGGIAMNSSCPAPAACVVRDNVLGGNEVAGVNFRDDTRVYDAPFDVVVEGNVANGDRLLRCGEWGIVCVDASPPEPPGGLVAVAGSGRVDLSWSEPFDDVGVVAYDVWRDGALVGSTPERTFSDATVAPETSYVYEVSARDGGGNVSPPSAAATVTTPPAPSSLFVDGFESGDLAAWDEATNVAVQDLAVASGTFAARATASSAPAFATGSLAAPVLDATVEARVRIDAHLTKNLTLLGLRTDGGGPLVTLYRTGKGTLGYRNHVTSRNKGSRVAVPLGAWLQLRIHVVVAGADGRVEVWLDGTEVNALTRADVTGASAAAALQIGETAKRSATAVFDDVVAWSGS